MKKTERDKHAEMFADYMIEAMARTRLRQAEIARLTDLSRTTISQLVGKKPNSVTGKLLLPERETVDRIAKAFGDPPSKARAAAGYSQDVGADTVEEALDAAMYFDKKGLSEADKEKLRPYLQMLDREADRLKKEPAAPRDDDERITMEEFDRKHGPAVKRIPSDQKADTPVDKLRLPKRGKK